MFPPLPPNLQHLGDSEGGLERGALPVESRRSQSAGLLISRPAGLLPYDKCI